MEAGQFIRGYFHNALATAAIEDILAACDLLYLLAVHQRLLIVRLIEHLVHSAGRLQHVFQCVSWTLLS